MRNCRIIYCKRDVDVEKAIRQKLHHFPIPESEMEMYRLDQESQKASLIYQPSASMTGASWWTWRNPNSVAQMKGWLEGKGLEIESLSKQAVSDLIKETDGEVEELLRLRLLMAKTSVKKYEAIHFYCAAE